LAIGLATCVLLAGPLVAQDVIVYPSQGQSAQKQAEDEYACYRWASGRTGFDPKAPPPSSANSGGTTASPLRGAAGGAAAGAVFGAIAGNAGKGAAIGAASGALLGGIRRRGEVDQQQAYAQQEAARYNEQLANYSRAYTACLEGRGYTVK
jgi:hypothetical protein